MDCTEPDVFQGEFERFLRAIGEFLDTETHVGQFGYTGVYDATKTNWANVGRGPPGARSKDNDRAANTGNWESFAMRERKAKERKRKKCKHDK